MLIFDEVISGFRWSRGGAQELYGITPDMTTMAKIVAGGLPGGAVGGRARSWRSSPSPATRARSFPAGAAAGHL